MRDGQPLFLTPKEFDTLLVLVEAAGKVVGKEELISRVWPDSYVGDGSLARNVSVLRKTLGEDVIQTHRGRGYRIALPVVQITSDPVVVTPEPLPKQNAKSADPSAKAGTEKASSRWHPGVLIRSAVVSVVLIAVAVSHFPGIRAATSLGPPIHSIVIEKDGALDPLTEGFELFRPTDQNYDDHVVYNRETNGWDRWRISTAYMNYYHRTLSSAEKDFALQRDWKLTCVCALGQGGGHVNIDFGSRAARFDIEFLQEEGRYFVALTKQISPKLEWVEKMEFPGVADIAHPHRYELRFDHVTQSASLWIDGQQMFSGYRGHHQFAQDNGLMFGAAVYGSAQRASLVVRTVRFEAN